MQALVLERKGELSLREIDLPAAIGPHDVKIAIHTVGICCSDVHYYEYGAIGPFVVKQPMVLGHEASGTVVEVDHPTRGKYLSVGNPIKLSDSLSEVKRSPLLGEHTDEILQKVLKFDETKVAEIKASGAVGGVTKAAAE